MGISTLDAELENAGNIGRASPRADHDRAAPASHSAKTETVGSEFDLREEQTALASSKLKIARERERLGKDRGRLEAERGRLEGERAILAAAELAFKRQRRRLARKFRHWRDKHRLANERRERHVQRLEAQSTQRGERLASVIAAARARTAQWREERDRLRRLLKQRGAELAEIRQRVKQLEGAAADRGGELSALDRLRERMAGESGNDSQQVQDLRADRVSLRARLEAAEKELDDRGKIQTELEQKLEDTQRRFEMAIGDLREYKRREAEAEEEGRSEPGQSENPNENRLDWEMQKLRLLGAMRSEADENVDGDQATIEGTIRITDEILAQKDQEIAELKQVLDHQSSNLGALAVGASAIGELFDSDELIRHEREKLQEMQLEWREKLRTAEIEISLERATLARERAAIEELQANQPPVVEAPPPPDPAVTPRKSSRGRWLARLGLRDVVEEKPSE
jgi:DNA repair exonuclease SbcCD ATPase subunit